MGHERWAAGHPTCWVIPTPPPVPLGPDPQTPTAITGSPQHQPPSAGPSRLQTQGTTEGLQAARSSSVPEGGRPTALILPAEVCNPQSPTHNPLSPLTSNPLPGQLITFVASKQMFLKPQGPRRTCPRALMLESESQCGHVGTLRQARAWETSLWPL